MIKTFLDRTGVSAHNRFQVWRTEHQRGVFLTLDTRTHANLHGARCPHFGSGPPYFLSDDGLGSLTTKKKVCGAELELFSWATENGVTVSRCTQCVQKRLVGRGPTPPFSIAPHDLSEELEGLEGAALRRLTLHRRRERRLRDAKIAEALKRGRLRCEVPGCRFDFQNTYGTLGSGYAQVHHIRPLSDRGEDTRTSLHDLAVVCANCHVMIHRGGECRQLDGLIADARLAGKTRPADRG
jgi:5-methylcytosine-specific restriction endonuclease McrA